MLESVQERATKLVDGMKNLNYVQRPETLDLPTLWYRRQRGDMMYGSTSNYVINLPYHLTSYLILETTENIDIR